jgi:hypothetical protein
MHKYLFATCLLAITFLSFNLETPTGAYRSPYFSADKQEYFRYEMIELSYQPDSASALNPDSVSLAASFYHADTLLTAAGKLDGIKLKYDKNRKLWRGVWPLPWNPPLGGYKAVVTVTTKQSKVDSTTLLLSHIDTLLLSDSTTFLVKSRSPQPIPAGFCAMTIETSCDVSRAGIRSPYDGSRRWQNFGEWARFLGADAVWFSLGWTIEGRKGTTDANPWIKDNFRALPRLAAEAHKQGYQFGAYVGSYLLWGPSLKQLKYDYSIEAKSGYIFKNHHVNLDDPKRGQDIVKVLKQLQDEPDVDFIGLDYIRPGAGGYETVNQFVEQMSVETPKNWGKWPPVQRILWVAKQVRVRDMNPVHARWQWWQAHRTALTVARLKKESGITKPLWGFTLGWDKGHEHGQDPCMMNDAGLDIDAVMMYESTAKHCWQMTSDWSTYLKGDEAQLLVGQEVDWPLVQNSLNPPGPEEMYWRWTDAIKGYTDGGRIKGMFWHDMMRGQGGRKGPYSSREWLIAGAAGFSKHRQELDLYPLTARLCFADNKLKLDLNLLRPVNSLKIEALSPGSPLARAEYDLASSQPDTSITLGRLPSNGFVSYRLTWDGAGPKDQIVLFAYLPLAYAQNPFRQWQAFRSGGDVLFAHQQDKETVKLAQKAGQVARSHGLIVNQTTIDSLNPALAYKYSKIVMVVDNKLSKKQKISLRDWFEGTGTAGNSTFLTDSGFAQDSLLPSNLPVITPGDLNTQKFAAFLKSVPTAPFKPGLESFIRLAAIDKK